MRCLLILIAGLVAVTAQDGLDGCGIVPDFQMNCCKIDTKDADDAIMRECATKFHDPKTCDFEICYGTKKGFVLSNGTIDMEILEDELDKSFEKYKGLGEIVKEKCFGNIDDYGLPESCFLAKLGHCVRFHTLANCPEWRSEEINCNKIRDNIEECNKKIEKSESKNK